MKTLCSHRQIFKFCCAQGFFTVKVCLRRVGFSLFLCANWLISLLTILSKEIEASLTYIYFDIGVPDREETPQFPISWSSFVRLLHTISVTLTCYKYFSMRRSHVLFTWWILLVPHWTLALLVLQTLGRLSSLNLLHHRLCPQYTCYKATRLLCFVVVTD